ncbi:MAG TPA: hypothetical protein VLF94_04405 [Chlamydiales bacterium]|nr:hypothetical protein [Chlamydiales bacterium]
MVNNAVNNAQPAPLPNQQLSADDLSAFRTAITNATNAQEAAIIQIGDVLYAVWRDPATQSIKIQDSVNYYAHNRQDNLIEVVIDGPGRVTSIKVNGRNQNQIPADLLPRFRQSFLKCLELSSRYQFANGTVEIQIIRRGINEIPQFHLEKLSEILKQHPNTDLRVSFLKNDGTRDEGVDAGGLSRDCLDDLFEHVTKADGLLRFERHPESNLLLPAPQGNNGALTFEENQMYRQMGQVMMYCYQNQRNLLIGRRFDNSIYRAAFSLTPPEIDREFAALPLAAKMKMCEEMARENNEPPGSLRLIQIARKGNGLSAADLMEVEDFLNMNGDLPPDFDHAHFNPDNPQQKAIVLKALTDQILERFKSLPAIHALAKGMKEIRARIDNIGFREFSRKIQGSLDRNVIINAIRVQGFNRGVQRKVDWLKEWIRDEATDDELQKFIKFVGGTSCLPVGRAIQVAEQDVNNPLPVPRAHSCFFQIDISPVDAAYGPHNDHTKENFIRSLKELALTDPTQYSMG